MVVLVWMLVIILNLHEWKPKDCYEMKMHVLHEWKPKDCYEMKMPVAVEIVFDFLLMKLLVLVLIILVHVAAVLVDH